MLFDAEFINSIKTKIKNAVLPVREELFLHDSETFDDDFRPGLK